MMAESHSAAPEGELVVPRLPPFDLDKCARPLSPARIDRAARCEWKTDDPAFHKVSRLAGEGEIVEGNSGGRNVARG